MERVVALRLLRQAGPLPGLATLDELAEDKEMPARILQVRDAGRAHQLEAVDGPAVGCQSCQQLARPRPVTRTNRVELSTTFQSSLTPLIFSHPYTPVLRTGVYGWSNGLSSCFVQDPVPR